MVRRNIYRICEGIFKKKIKRDYEKYGKKKATCFDRI
jgi:hypothetical protein